MVGGRQGRRCRRSRLARVARAILRYACPEVKLTERVLHPGMENHRHGHLGRKTCSVRGGFKAGPAVRALSMRDDVGTECPASSCTLPPIYIPRECCVQSRVRVADWPTSRMKRPLRLQ